jgi:pentatricopeptide repeat protein
MDSINMGGFIMGFKEEFEEIYNSKITRAGSAELLEWLKTTDFFTAPASTKFHCACLGGLVQHSVSVYRVMMKRNFEPDSDSEESFAICGLLHDVCKAQFYKESMRNVKNEETGSWEKRPYYMIEDSYPYGHGEKSVFLIERFMRLKTSEAIAIRWHMGGFDESVKGGSFSIGLAYQKYPIAVKLHLADLESTYLCEKGTSAVHGK